MIRGSVLELLKTVAPGVTRVAVLRDSETPTGTGQFAAIQSVASPFSLELSPVDVHGADVIEQGIAGFAREEGGGVIVTAGVTQAYYRKLIISLVARHRLPAVYPVRVIVSEGG